MHPNFQVPSIFLGLFLRKLEVPDFQNFADSLPWRLPEFDAEPQLQRQLPPNAPPDVPRVRFLSKDQRFMLEVAPAKLHFRMMPGEITQGPQGANVQTLGVKEAYERFVPAAARVHSLLAEHYALTASRLGVVTEFIAPTPSSANQRLHKLLLSGNHLGERLQDLQIQALTRVTLGDGINANRRVAVRPLRTGQEGNPDLAISVQVDINTLAEEPYDVSTSDLDKFLQSVSNHLQTKIPLLDEKGFFE